MSVLLGAGPVVPAHAQYGPSATPVWSPALRFFRLGQSASDPYSAFREIFRAVENLLAKHWPRTLEPKIEPEKEWLIRALREFNATRPSVEGKDWLGYLGLDDFVETVYRHVRHGTIHAKTGERFLVPYDEESDKEVRRGLVSLNRLFLELAASEFHWKHNERPQIEEDFLSTGQMVGSFEIWPFQDTPIESGTKKVDRRILRVKGVDVHLSPAAGTVDVIIPREALEGLHHVDGWTSLLNNQPVAFEEVGYRIPTKDVESLALRLTLLVQPRAMIRTRF